MSIGYCVPLMEGCPFNGVGIRINTRVSCFDSTNHDKAEIIQELSLNTNQSEVHCWTVILSIGQVFDLKHGKYYHIVCHGWRAPPF